MKCTNCGYENAENFDFCPDCGSPLQSAVSHSPAARLILPAMKDRLFLVICILMSASCLFSLSTDGLPLINILITVFLWLTFSQSQKDIADAKHLRCISGCVYAMYIINFVIAGLLTVLGIILTAAFSFLTNASGYWETLLSDFVEMEAVYSIIQALTFIPSGLILFFFVLISAIMIVINIFSIRYLHRFIQSVYRSLEQGTLTLCHVNTARIWLYVLGGFGAISFLGNLGESLIAAMGSGVSAAVAIVTGILIQKYLLPKSAATEPAN